MQLLYGTYNPAKLEIMRRWLVLPGLELLGLSSLPDPPPEPEETGATPLENARIKATAYRDATGMTTLSADSALYIQGLPEAAQPAVHARRRAGGRMGDEEMLAYYAALVHDLGGRALAQYRNALCIAFAQGGVAERFEEDIFSAPFYLVDTPHPARRAGFPLDSLSVEPQSGRYYYDLEEAHGDADLFRGEAYRNFVREALGLSDDTV